MPTATGTPRHVAIIMDGNGRWATSKGWPRLVGHRKGAERVKEIVRVAPDLGIQCLTIYAFSTENWKRSTEEVLGLMGLFARYINALDTNPIPDPDLVIRTSGETRVSNFLLWQAAYAEYEFTPILWPDFTPEVLAEILGRYGNRDRRFGGVSP